MNARFARLLPLLTIASLLTAQTTSAGPIRDWIKERRAQREDTATPANDDEAPSQASFGPGVQIRQDLTYGADARQRFDVYTPAKAQGAPVLFMVHGGAWAFGDKHNSQVVDNKVKHWVAQQGFVMLSVNYRMVPQAAPYEQMKDVARALAQAQQQARQWGADQDRFILMGHSAGAHLVALLNADPSVALSMGAKPWLGTVMLDSGAIDVPHIMNTPHHYAFYDRAFGSDPQAWLQASPMAQITAQAKPMLAICSSQRQDSCPQAKAFIGRAHQLGVSADMLPQNLSHSDVNKQLGLPGAYTDAVDAFILKLPGFKPGANP